MYRKLYTICASLFFINTSFSQTDIDGLMMDKHLFCAGATYGKSSWKNYWEGTFKRENLNLGNVTTSNVAIMGNYGITNSLNVIASVPYISTKASAGQLQGQHGIQDASLFLKWVGYSKHIANGQLKAFVIGGVSAPLSKYTPDLLPLSIGLHCNTATIRGMIDYEKGNWFGTISGSYIFRSNVTLDRNTYYTTQLHYTNQVEMPNATNINIRLGYRSSVWIVEAFGNKFTTLGGFDITKNNMPFVSNKMNAISIGFYAKYQTKFVNGLSIVANGMTTIAGRNVGQSNSFNTGVLYIMDFSKKESTKATTN